MDLFGEFTHFSRVRAIEGWPRGRKTLLEAIQQLEDTQFIGAHSNPKSTPAQEIDPSRLSLPEKAAVYDPAQHLTSSQREILADLSRIVLPPCDQPRVVPRACHWLSAEGEDLLREKLVEIGLAEPVLAFEVPVDCHGKALVSGLFCVPHKKESDRLIIDRRGPNAHESRLEWARLPHGSLLAQIRVTAA